MVSPGDAKRLLLRTTFGLVASQDQGKTFQWVCEKAAGFINGEDPPVEVTQDSSILVLSSQALNISHDGGCGWQTALDTLSIIDADVDPSQPKRTVAIASLYMDGKTCAVLEESLDNGVTMGNAPRRDIVRRPARNRRYRSVSLRHASARRHRDHPDQTPLISITTDDNGAHLAGFTAPPRSDHGPVFGRGRSNAPGGRVRARADRSGQRRAGRKQRLWAAFQDDFHSQGWLVRLRAVPRRHTSRGGRPQ